MLPVMAIDNHRNCALADSVFSRQNFIGDCTSFVAAAQFCHLRFGEFCGSAPAILAYLVGYIIGVSAKPEMRRIDTQPVIARMENLHTPRNGAVMQFVTEPMGKLMLFSVAYQSITGSIGTCSPFPTGIRSRFINFLPKANMDGAALIMAFDKPHRLAFDALSCSVSFLGNICAIAATAATETIGNYLRGMMGLHDDLQSLCQAAGRFQRRCGISISSLNYSANRRFSQVVEAV